MSLRPQLILRPGTQVRRVALRDSNERLDDAAVREFIRSGVGRVLRKIGGVGRPDAWRSCSREDLADKIATICPILDDYAVTAGIDAALAEIERANLPHGGRSTCPLCHRRWIVTPADDCLLPICGCYGAEAAASNPHLPRERCTLRHPDTCDEVRRETDASDRQPPLNSVTDADAVGCEEGAP